MKIYVHKATISINLDQKKQTANGHSNALRELHSAIKLFEKVTRLRQYLINALISVSQ